MRPGTSVRIGLATGAAGGALVGMIAAIAGGIFSPTQTDMQSFVQGGYLLLAGILPLFLALNIMVNPDTAAWRPWLRQHSYQVAALAWLPALGLATVVFMMPVTLAPILFGKGVTFENVSEWYSTVLRGIVAQQVLIVVVVSAIGFGLVALASSQKAP